MAVKAIASNHFSLSLNAIIATMPLAIAVIPWGILTGALAIQTGMSAWQAQCMSLLVFAGAAQLSAMTLMASAASYGAILGSTFVISSRHLLYSIVFREHVQTLPFRWRVAIGFLLTDEMFAVSEAHTRQTSNFSPIYALVSGAAFYAVWNMATLIGIVVGESLQDLESLGLDFAIAATFIAMTFGELRRFPVLLAIIGSGVSAVLIQPILHDAYIIIAALLGMIAAYFADGSSASQVGLNKSEGDYDGDH